MDKELLFKPRLPEDTVDVPGIGTVRVRGLNRAEATMIESAGSTEAKERKILALGVVDPALTEAEVGRWMKAAPAGEIQPVSTRIAQLSGMLDDSAKTAVKTFRDGPDE